MWGTVGKTSLIWTIALLFLIIAGLVLMLPNGKFVVDYISFASSIASLILALVAIFYSIISSEGFYTSISDIKGLSTDISEESSKLASNSDKLLKISDDIISNLSQIPSSFDELRGQVDGRFDELMSNFSKTDEVIDDKKPETPSKNQIFPKKPTVGASISIYLLVIAFENGKKFSTNKIFNKVNIIEYVTAYISCLATFEIHGLKIKYTGKDFEIESLGDINADYVKENIEKNGKEGFVKLRSKEINSYFSLNNL